MGQDGIILALHGFNAVDILHEQGGLKVDAGATSSISNLKKLLAGRGRFYCHRLPGIKWEIRQAGMENQVRLLGNFQVPVKFYMAVSKMLAKEDVDKISYALTRLENSKELKRIFDQYQK